MIEHITPAGANIFADLGIDAPEAQNLFVRSQLMHEMVRLVRARNLKQTEAAALFGVSQPRISELTRGKIDSFTIDSLVNMLATAGLEVRVTVQEPKHPPASLARDADREAEPEYAAG